MVWDSLDDLYRVIFSSIRFGKSDCLPDRYYAMRRIGGQFEIISIHRSKARAFDACERHAAK